MSVTDLSKPRYLDANATPPGDPAFWRAMLDQSDNFAFKTARDGQGGPFGAQLWLVNERTDEYRLVGTAEQREASNAVLAKGIASAHAESENLSPENREQVTRFLQAHRGEGWQVVQVSSGESCPSCRAKQVHFAFELIDAALIDRGEFTVVFKATYEQTASDAGFGDAPCDMAFRAVRALQLLDDTGGLLRLQQSLSRDCALQSTLEDNDLRLVGVGEVDLSGLSPDIAASFGRHADMPMAVLRWDDGILVDAGHGRSIERVLHQAAQRQQRAGVRMPWNLNGAEIFTNIADIGPLAYAECFWFNVAAIRIITDAGARAGSSGSRECPPVSNRDFFRAVAAPYNSADTPLRTAHLGDPAQASIAHLYWRANTAREDLLNRQAARLPSLSRHNVRYINDMPLALEEMIEADQGSSHYDRPKD